MGIAEHQKDYKEEIWKQYSLLELGNWVHNFHKRAFHRNNIEKSTKDMHDSKNYLYMMEQKLKERCIELGIDWEKI